MAKNSITDLSKFIDSDPDTQFWMGMDVHKRSYSIALLRSDGIFHTWKAPAEPEKLLKAIKRFKHRVMGVCYESGPTGFTLARTLQAADVPVIMAAPSKILRAVSPGSKTDRLDCIKLALFVSKGLVRPIAIPTIKEESERALIRRRHQLADEIRRCKQRIKALFLFCGYDEPQALKHWSKSSIDILHTIPFPEAEKMVLDSYLRALAFCKKEKSIIESELDIISQRPEHSLVIDALTTVPGVGFITATTFHLELFRPERFNRAEEVASYLGLAPTVKHSGEKHPNGHLVPVGQKRLRSLLIEASWIWVSKDSYASGLYRKYFSKSGISQKAIAAVARKLAIILWRLSIEKRAYRNLAA